MGLIGALIFGLIAGAVAKLLMPGKDPGGCIVTSLIGVVGAMIGQSLGSFVFKLGPMDRWSFGNFILAVLGSVILLVIYRFITKRKGRL